MSHDQLVNRLADLIDELAGAATANERLRVSLRRLFDVVSLEPKSESTEATDSSLEPSTLQVAATPSELEVATSETRSRVEVENASVSWSSSVDAAQIGRSEPLPKLTLGQSKPPEPAAVRTSQPRRSEEARVDLSLVARRCRIKAEACRWACERRGLLARGATFATAIEPTDRALIEKAREIPECYLWMCQAYGPNPERATEWLDVAQSFEAVALACETLVKVGEDWESQQQEFVELLKLLAEAQSGLRIGVVSLGANVDHDQILAFNFLKTTTLEKKIFIARFMRIDDPADRSRIEALIGEIKSQNDRLDEKRDRERVRRKLLSKIKHKVKVLTEDSPYSPEEFRILVLTVETLVEQGLPVSNRELREALMPIIDRIPEYETIPAGFERVLREIDQYLALNASDEDDGSNEADAVSAEVQQCIQLLAGRKVVLIGGQRRPQSHRALREAFQVSEVIWIETREHQSIEIFEPYVARDDVAVVLLAIRWASHSFGDVKNFCDRYGKPLVRLPGGYNANQIAVQILQQCSDRLRARAS